MYRSAFWFLPKYWTDVRGDSGVNQKKQKTEKKKGYLLLARINWLPYKDKVGFVGLQNRCINLYEFIHEEQKESVIF